MGNDRRIGVVRGICVICVTLLHSLLVAQTVEEIHRTSGTFRLDGVLHEPEWKSALTLTNFKQIEPNIGMLSTENLEVSLMYDERFMYFGVNNVYENTQDLFATTLERDAPQDRDDYVEFHIDTYNDKINVLVFRVNPLGTRQDLEVSRNGEEFNTSWNTFWDTRSQVNDRGWTSEIRIPFSSLRFHKASENVMRIRVVAKYKLKNELVITPLINADVTQPTYNFNNSVEVKFKDLPSSKPLYVTPYTKASLIHQNTLNGEGIAYESEVSVLERKQYFKNETLDKLGSNIGIDLKYKPSANHTLDVTFNTDFAEVESDDRIINISRFPILLPEKRLFFLENADLFNSNQFDHRLFNSRAIGIEEGQSVPIIGGLRFTGSNSKWQYGFMDLQTQKVQGLVSSNNMSVLRLRRNFGALGSNIGMINTNKIGSESNNHLVAFDTNINLSNTVRTWFTIGTTFDKETGNWKPMYGAEINTFRANGFGLNYRFREYTEHFNPELGFVERPNTQRLTLNNGWRRTYTRATFLRHLSVGHYFNKFWVSSTGQNEFFQTNIYLNAVHKKGYRFTLFAPVYQKDNLYEDWEIAEGIIVSKGAYEMWNVEPRFSTGNARQYQLNVNTLIGKFYDGNRFTFSYRLSYDFNKTLSAEIGGAYNSLSFPSEFANGVSDKVNLSRYFSRLKLNFSSKSNLNSYFQYDTRNDQLGINLRYRYNPIEGTDFFLVYNHNANLDRDMLSPRAPFTQDQVVILKFSKTLIY
ncbi:MAG: hypothetical protein Aureis2KO_00510 [Aureisphaera sp.]